MPAVFVKQCTGVDRRVFGRSSYYGHLSKMMKSCFNRSGTGGSSYAWNLNILTTVKQMYDKRAALVVVVLPGTLGKQLISQCF